MCPMFVYKSAPNVFGISRTTGSPKLPDLDEEWCLVEAMRGQRAECSSGGSDEAMILEIMKNLDNEMFLQLMEFLEEEGYNVCFPGASQNLLSED